MSRRDPVRALRHILDHAREIRRLIRGRKREDLDKDRLLNLALVRLLEIVGEAAIRVPPEEQRDRPAIPWSQLVGLRNRLIHGYDDVDFDILWEIVTKDIPALIKAVEKKG